MSDEPVSISENIQRYLKLYSDEAARGPKQAELLIPQWAQDRLNAMEPEARQRILDEVDQIASWHGLRTPTTFSVPQHVDDVDL